MLRKLDLLTHNMFNVILLAQYLIEKCYVLKIQEEEV